MYLSLTLFSSTVAVLIDFKRIVYSFSNSVNFFLLGIFLPIQREKNSLATDNGNSRCPKNRCGLLVFLWTGKTSSLIISKSKTLYFEPNRILVVSTLTIDTVFLFLIFLIPVGDFRMRWQFIIKRFLITRARFPRQQKTRILNFRKRYEKTIQ